MFLVGEERVVVSMGWLRVLLCLVMIIVGVVMISFGLFGVVLVLVML